MAYALSAGIEISINGSTWYKLTDHNRGAISYSPELIESATRMANGKMRKFVIAKKEKISTDWKFVPSKTSECVDGNHGPAWLESFYQANRGIPVYVKVISSELSADPATGSAPNDALFVTAASGSKTYITFITGFTKTLNSRTQTSDYVDMSIEFTEI